MFVLGGSGTGLARGEPAAFGGETYGAADEIAHTIQAFAFTGLRDSIGAWGRKPPTWRPIEAPVPDPVVVG